MKLKDALVGFLFWIGILAFGAILISVDGLPLWVLLILAAIAWVAYILIIIRDYQRAKKNPPRLWMKIGGKWRAIDSNGFLIPENKTPPAPTPRRAPAPTQPVFDQEEVKR